jgi:signal peptidase I
LVLFRSPRDSSIKYIKRVVGLEGETVEFDENGIRVNGALLKEGIFARLLYSWPARGPFAPQEEGIKIPAKTVFVLGDNIQESVDSRSFGPVPVGSIIGKAYKRYWPPGRAGPLE